MFLPITLLNPGFSPLRLLRFKLNLHLKGIPAGGEDARSRLHTARADIHPVHLQDLVPDLESDLGCQGVLADGGDEDTLVGALVDGDAQGFSRFLDLNSADVTRAGSINR